MYPAEFPIIRHPRIELPIEKKYRLLKHRKTAAYILDLLIFHLDYVALVMMVCSCLR